MDTPDQNQWPPVFYTLWDEAWDAIAKPRQYIKWAYQPFKRSLQYLAILLAILSIAITSYFYLAIRPELVTAQSWLGANVPQVTVASGKLAITDDKTFQYTTDNKDLYIKVDPTVTLAQASLDPVYDNGLLVLQDGVYARTEGQVQTNTYADLGLDQVNFTGQQAASFIGGFLTWAIVIVPVTVFVYLFLSNLVFTFLASVVYWIFSWWRLPLRRVWSMSLYALTPGLLVGYLSFIFYPIPGITSIVFFIYLMLAVIQYWRFLDFQAKWKDKQ